jgi:hypothetical protein
MGATPEREMDELGGERKEQRDESGTVAREREKALGGKRMGATHDGRGGRRSAGHSDEGTTDANGSGPANSGKWRGGKGWEVA